MFPARRACFACLRCFLARLLLFALLIDILSHVLVGMSRRDLLIAFLVVGCTTTRINCHYSLDTDTPLHYCVLKTNHQTGETAMKQKVDVTHEIRSIDEIPLENIAFIIAKAEIECKGFYTYKQGGMNHRIVMVKEY